MIPILYESNETEFTTNGLGRLRDCIECIVTEERNGIYECDFSYPVNGVNYDQIQLGRIIAVQHDDTDDVQPFDIVSMSRPIDGVVEFHAVHISYRLSKYVITLTNVNSLGEALNALTTAQPSCPFTYWTNKSSTGYLGCSDGIPRSVRMVLGGVEGSILDSYGGEYEWDKFGVKLWRSRGEDKDLTIRYGVNLLDYEDETDYSESYSCVVPYWSNVDTTVVGDMIDTNVNTYNGRKECVTLDLSDKFESAPTKAALENMAREILSGSQPYLPIQTVKVDFVSLEDSTEFSQYSALLDCRLCDTINIVYPQYNVSGRTQIVKTVYDVLSERFENMELGTLSVSLSQALGVSATGTVLPPKSDGDEGVEIVSIVTEYCLSSSMTELIPYTAWSETLPTYQVGYYYWERTRTEFSDGRIIYSDPVYSQTAQVAAEANAAVATAQQAADDARLIADSALGKATTTEQHFWYDSTGAHIAENAGDLTTGASQTIASTGTVIMRNGKLVTSWTGSSSSNAALNFYDCTSSTASSSDLVASYSRAGTTMYVNNKRTMALTNSGLSFYNPSDGTTLMSVFGASGVDLYAGGVNVSSFTGSTISLGKNSTSSTIQMCGGSLSLSAGNKTLGSNTFFTTTFENVNTSSTGSAIELKVKNAQLYLNDYNSGSSINAYLKAGATTLDLNNSSGFNLQATSTSECTATNFNGTLTLRGKDAIVSLHHTSSDTAPIIECDGRLVVDNNRIKNLYGYANTITGTANMYISSNGYIGRATTVSSKRFKHDIKDIEDKTLDPHNLYKIEIKQFKYNEDVITDKTDRRYGKDLIGFIAEQVHENFPIAVDMTEDGLCETWNGRYMIPPMLALIQEQHQQIEELAKRVKAIEGTH